MESAAETCRRTDESAVVLTNGPIAVDQHEAGRKAGYEAGRTDWYQAGYNKGYDEGFQMGLEAKTPPEPEPPPPKSES